LAALGVKIPAAAGLVIAVLQRRARIRQVTVPRSALMMHNAL
jgi:hypothetical protein